MKTEGCFTIIENSEGEILLMKRRDYPIWDLPGGRLDHGESLELCAIRETKEETGYQIAVKLKIGEYEQPQLNDIQHLFSGEIIGGEQMNDGPETSKVYWFRPDRLPVLMVPNRKRQIKNYLRNKDAFNNETLNIPLIFRLINNLYIQKNN
ncbi:NUDIX hydrolase [Metabacillus idriensis]|uniref:NUDIX hydrolase n=1 Tax=Metabacillus idriensis TaxID=324768 RepID=UPI00204138D9|nr:NUDIX hydrolase [Metabacillus idriensis]MCM3596780.1 NUDIX hydrolase [Metabacillus idriensis]